VLEHGGPSVHRRRLAAELRRLREHAGFIGEEVADRLGWSASKVSRIETSKSELKQADLQLLLDLYRVGEPHRSELLALRREFTQEPLANDSTIASLRAGYSAFVYAEAEAITLWTWEPLVLPGLLHTEGYAREVMRGWSDMFDLSPTELETRVEARIMRQQVLNRDLPLELSAVLDESVIHRQFGDSFIMRRQLERLIESSEMPNIEIRVLPLIGYHPIGTGPFVYMQFMQDHAVPVNDIVTVEQLTSHHYIEDTAQTNMYRVTFERLRAEALGVTQSRALIAAALREI
jgi:transcriptional regulator with XRE-family HTH domain